MNRLLSTFKTRLTTREQEILQCITDGLSSKQIADRLYISVHTVANHRKNMLKKRTTKSESGQMSHSMAGSSK